MVDNKLQIRTKTMQFTKLFNSILDSTIWQEPLETKVVWITMLAMVDRNGELHASIPGLARRAGVTIQQCHKALSCLESPDQYSRTKEHEGRRIEEIDGGWRLLNHGKYRALLSAEERREYNRRKQAEYREAKCQTLSTNVKQCQQMSAECTHTDAEAESDADTSKERDKSLLSVNARKKVDYSQFIESLWNVFPPTSKGRSSKAQLFKQWKATTHKPNEETVMESARRWADCYDWTKDGGQWAQGAHRWIKDRKWESEPPPPPRMHKGKIEQDITLKGF
jgi:hypothetical protein